MVHKGFSLIELLITISILFIILFISVPKIFYLKDFILQNEVEKLASVFYYLQQKSITLNQEQYLKFNLKSNSYFYLGKDNKIQNYFLPEDVRFGIIDGVLGPPTKPVDVIKNVISFKQVQDNIFEVTFYTDGIISSGIVYFTNKDKKSLMALSCPVSPYSCVRKYKYQKKLWAVVN